MFLQKKCISLDMLSNLPKPSSNTSSISYVGGEAEVPHISGDVLLSPVRHFTYITQYVLDNALFQWTAWCDGPRVSSTCNVRTVAPFIVHLQQDNPSLGSLVQMRFIVTLISRDPSTGFNGFYPLRQALSSPRYVFPTEACLCFQGFLYSVCLLL